MQILKRGMIGGFFLLVFWIASPSQLNASVVVSEYTSVPDGVVGTDYTYQMPTDYTGDATWSLALTAGESLPTGLSLAESGVLSGNPNQVGDFYFTATMVPEVSTQTTQFTINVSSDLEYPSGTLIKRIGDPTVFYLVDQQIYGFRTPAEFLSYGFNWDWVVEVTSMELDIYTYAGPLGIQNGTIFKEPNNPTVYLKSDDGIHPFSSATIFLNLGYQWNAIIVGIDGEASFYSHAPLMEEATIHFEYTKVKLPNNPTVYILRANEGGSLVLYGIPSQGVFFSHGWNWPEIIEISADEMSHYGSGGMLYYRDGTLISNNGAVYVLEHGQKRLIVSASDFYALRYQWQSVVDIPDSEASAIPTGDVLEAGSYRRALYEQEQAFSSDVISGSIATSKGTFSYTMIKTTKAGTAIKTISETKEDCLDNCPVQSLAEYVNEQGGFAGIHGTYFCPPDYGCSGHLNSYDSPVYDSSVNRWVNWSKYNYDYRSIMTFSGGTVTSYVPSTEAPPTGPTGIDAGITSYPMLVHEGSIIASSANTDTNQQSKATRAGIGVDGQYYYFVVVSNASVEDAAYVFQALGADEALNLDGGGTTAMYHNGSYVVGPGRYLPNAIVLVRR